MNIMKTIACRKIVMLTARAISRIENFFITIVAIGMSVKRRWFKTRG